MRVRRPVTNGHRIEGMKPPVEAVVCLPKQNVYRHKQMAFEHLVAAAFV